MTRKHDGKGRPEFRIPVMVPGTLLLGVGMFWYGWSAQAKLYWIMPNIGCSLFYGRCHDVHQLSERVHRRYLWTILRQCYSSDLNTEMHSRVCIFIVCSLYVSIPFQVRGSKLIWLRYQRLGYCWAATVLGLIALGIRIPAISLL